ncbi:ABC transporter substrate-binding protein [Amycolatopsis acidiphila]|uniref:ABC transporter substrate-binding protein n=1 Tax=Amycolatopsis acidiphila TaxID=715473 RepID=A0A558AML3_9PSEU|nr:ABC transporter substrate-binding protein [Amycolatopsis acidiphila]TVT25506.1 ABC transporter substrate-binding protein [Amycolatopsis acidiphila]UIJ60247.1 ABC transporter substrate-binding protein [Amycolatopsis acidiphila]GHG60522.1 ABC transporter substrate-binding protein [Amycolatopsis acidiphila]
MTDRRSVLKALAAAPLLFAAGCATRESTTPAGVLNIGQISDSVAFLPLFIAEKQGYFKAAGITLGERPRLGTGAKVAAALKSGSVDLGAGVITDAFNLAKIDDGTRLVTSLVTEYYVDVVVPPSFPEPASLNEKIQALVGRKIGITGPGSGTEALVDYLFSSIGRNAATDSTLVNLGSATTSAIGAMKTNRVDALAFFQPIAQQAAAANVGRTYISPARGDVPSLRGALHGVVFSTRKLLDRKQEELAAFQRAMTRALADIHGAPAQARSLLGQYLKGTDAKALDALMPILPREVPATPQVQRGSFETARKFHLDSGLVKKAPSYEAVLYNQPGV